MKKALVRYLPIFREDLIQAINYIRDVLQNPQAANELIDAIEEAIIKRSESADSFERYYSFKEREYPYYRIYIKNYVVYYVVIPGEPQIMEVRRLLYMGRNRDLIV